MHTLDDSGAIFRYHRDMAALHGANSSYALGWRSERDQQIRFAALTQIAPLNGKTILDAGCGYADLFTYLRDRYAIGLYCGVEQIPELLYIAIRRYGHLPSMQFISGNFLSRDLPICDYVFASGSLNYSSSEPDFIYKAISKLYSCCSEGLAFNLLSTVSAPGLLTAYAPEDILAYCRTLSNRVAFDNSYAAEDFTVLMYR